MNDAKLTRELKSIIYYLRQFGIDRVNKSLEEISSDQILMDDFLFQVHKGFYFAQERVIPLLTKNLNEQKRIKNNLAEARRKHNKDDSARLVTLLKKVQFQECVIRKCMDAIAWQLFNYDLSTLRRLYCGEERIDITDSNLESEITFVSQFQETTPKGFALISDLTSFVQIGDLVTLSPSEGVKLVELKEGKVNEKIFQLIAETFHTQPSDYLQSRLNSEGKSFTKHFERTVKQIKKDVSTCSTINSGRGIDHASGLNVHILDEKQSPDSFSTVMRDLSIECVKKGYSIAAIQECLIIGVYDLSRFPSDVFSVWAASLGIKDPIFDLRQSFYAPLGFPMYLHPFSETFITDVIAGRIVVKMAINTDQWLNMLVADGCNIRHMTKKETARIKAKSKASNTLYELDGQGIAIEKDGATMYLGQGLYSKMFTNFFTPLSMCQEILSYLEDIKELNTKKSE